MTTLLLPFLVAHQGAEIACKSITPHEQPVLTPIPEHSVSCPIDLKHLAPLGFVQDQIPSAMDAGQCEKLQQLTDELIIKIGTRRFAPGLSYSYGKTVKQNR